MSDQCPTGLPLLVYFQIYLEMIPPHPVLDSTSVCVCVCVSSFSLASLEGSEAGLDHPFDFQKC